MCLKEKDSHICNSQGKREARNGGEGGNGEWFTMHQGLPPVNNSFAVLISKHMQLKTMLNGEVDVSAVDVLVRVNREMAPALPHTEPLSHCFKM